MNTLGPGDVLRSLLTDSIALLASAPIDELDRVESAVHTLIDVRASMFEDVQSRRRAWVGVGTQSVRPYARKPNRRGPEAMTTRTLVGAPIVDSTTSTSRARSIGVELNNLERPSGSRVFVRVTIDDDNEQPAQRRIDLEPEQARRLAAILEHGADIADREPVRLMRKLVGELAYYDGSGSKTLDEAAAWLKRHDPK